MSIVLRVFRPHVHERDGTIATPDLLLTELAIALPGRAPLPVSVHAWSSDVAVQCEPLRTRSLPAWGIVAASRGPLVLPAVVHVDLRALESGDVRLALATSVCLGARSAWRLGAAAAAAAKVWLTLEDAAAFAIVGRWSLAAAAAVHEGLARLVEGAALAPERAVLFAMDHAGTLDAGRRCVALAGGGDRLALAWSVAPFAPGEFA